MTDPYRAPSEAAAPEAANDADPLAALGPLRSTHTPAPLRRSLVAPITAAVSIGFVGTMIAVTTFVGAKIFLGILPFTILVFVLLAWGPFRLRGTRVELYTHGIVVATPRGRDVIAFEDTDELWWKLDLQSTWFGTIMWVRSLRLVDHDGRSHTIPTQLEGGVDLARAIVQRCSGALQADAVRALQRGETLTFADIQLDRDWIRGPRWAARWADLSLVRYAPGRIALFRGQRIVPWRKISLDRVPHPTIFVKLVTERAPTVEIDDPMGALNG